MSRTSRNPWRRSWIRRPARSLAAAAVCLGVCPAIAAGPAPASATERLELEDLLERAEVTSGEPIVQPMAGFGSGWGNDAQIFWRPGGEAGESLRLRLDLDEPGAYDLVLFYTVAPDYGDFAVVVDGRETPKVTGYEATVALRSVALGRHELGPGGPELHFVVTGKDPRSAGYILGLDRIELARAGVEPVTPTTPVPRIPPSIPGPGRMPGPAPAGPRDEFLVVAGDRAWLGQVGEAGDIRLGPALGLPEGLRWAGNFDGEGGDELLTWDPATGKHFLTRFPSEGSAATEEVYRPQAFDPAVMRTVGRFAEASATCLLGWKDSESFGLRRLVENVCFSATALFPIQGMATPADVTGDGRDEAVFATPEGTLDVVVLGGHRPIEDASYESLEFSLQRAADRWSAGLEIAPGDFDGDGAQELAATLRSKGEVWRLDFDAAGRVESRTRLASGWPAGRALLKAVDIDGDGHDELLARDAASGEFSIATLGAESLDLAPLEGLDVIRPTFVYPGRFQSGPRHALLLHEVVSGRDGRLGTLFFEEDASTVVVDTSSGGSIPELATVLVADFLPE